MSMIYRSTKVKHLNCVSATTLHIRNNLKRMNISRQREAPREKEGTADNPSRNEIRPLFALVKLAPLCISITYIQLNLSMIMRIRFDWQRIDFDQWEFCVVWATRISFSDVLSAVPPFLLHARKSKPVERRDRSQSNISHYRIFPLIYSLPYLSSLTTGGWQPTLLREILRDNNLSCFVAVRCITLFCCVACRAVTRHDNRGGCIFLYLCSARRISF
jgi:hypothetical protein